MGQETLRAHDGREGNPIAATLDTSVQVRALNFGGPAAALLARARAGDIPIDISEPILKETIDVLIQQIEKTARSENRRPSEVLEDAWRGYVEEKSWVKLVERGQENAKRLGIEESEVDRLIHEYRAEKRGR